MAGTFNLTRKPHRFIPTCDISQGWWDCYYSFMTCCRGPKGLDYWDEGSQQGENKDKILQPVDSK